MAAWVKCERCKKVKPGGDFQDAATVCRACQTSPVKAPVKAKAGPVSTRRTATAATPAVPPGPRAPLIGVAGSGDLEVRERRARRKALEQLAETHAEDYEHLLQAARRGEGLRA